MIIIGTDATHAEHIETIKQRQYVGVNPDGSFVPGELGMGLVEGRNTILNCSSLMYDVGISV